VNKGENGRKPPPPFSSALGRKRREKRENGRIREIIANNRKRDRRRKRKKTKENESMGGINRNFREFFEKPLDKGKGVCYTVPVKTRFNENGGT